MIDPSAIYDQLPKTERTLIKRYKGYPFRIANDRGKPCDWFIYDGSEPIAVVTYYKGRKLVLHIIARADTLPRL